MKENLKIILFYEYLFVVVFLFIWASFKSFGQDIPMIILPAGMLIVLLSFLLALFIHRNQ